MFGLNLFSHQFWPVAGMSFLCGAIVGLERELRGKPAGVRTCILVAMGTAMFVRLGIIVAGDRFDPTRVLGQVVTGIGFLGAGVIFNRRGSVEGVTTAATIWVLAAIGAMIGAGQMLEALALSILTVLILVLVNRVEMVIDRWRGDEKKVAERVKE